MDKKIKIVDVLIIGFAVFAMFFGAGNLIFPPYLGWKSGSNWLIGFICFIVIDVGLSVFAMIVTVRSSNGISDIIAPLGRRISVIIVALSALCLGPLIAVPRTAATTYEFAVMPFMPWMNSWVSSMIFFALTVIMCLKQTSVVDIIGAVLSPVMLIALAVLIIRGASVPLGQIMPSNDVANSIREGILSGYQTMDMIAATLLTVTVVASMLKKGYHTKQGQTKVVAFSGVVAATGLFLVYGGLAYLGATVSERFVGDMAQSELLISITEAILGRGGIALLGIIVMFACLTTAIGLISSCAQCICDIAPGRMNYKKLVIIFAAFSFVISNLGISRIIAFAGPILDIIYPILIIMVTLAAFPNRFRNSNIHKGAVIGAVAISVLSIIESKSGIRFGITLLPLAEYGFAWLVPAVIAGFVGALLKPRLAKRRNAID